MLPTAAGLLINDKRAAEITRKHSRIQPVEKIFRCVEDPDICLTMDPARPESSNLVNVAEREAIPFSAEEFACCDLASREFRLIWSVPKLAVAK